MSGAAERRGWLPRLPAKQTLTRDATVLALATLISQPISLIGGAFVRSQLVPRDAGIIGAVGLFWLYGGYAHLGFLFAAERELPLRLGHGDRRSYWELREASRRVALVGACVAVAVAAALSLRSGGHHEAGPLLLAIAAANLLVQQTVNHQIVVLRANTRFDALSLIQVEIALLTAISNALGVVVWGLTGFFAAMLLSSSVQAVLQARELRDHEGAEKSPVSWRRGVQILRHELPGSLSLLVVVGSLLLMRTIDNLIVLQVLGVAQLGVYSIALIMNNALFGATTAAANAIYPRVLRQVGATGSTAELGPLSRVPNRMIGMLLPVLCIVAAVWVRPAVELFLPKYRGGVRAAQIMAMSTFFFGMTQLAVNVLIAAKQYATICAFTLLGVAATTLLVLTIDHPSLAQVAMATGLGYATTCCVLLYRATRVWGTSQDARTMVGWSVVAPFGWGVACLLLASWVASRSPILPKPIVASLLALPLYGLLLIGTRTSRQLLRLFATARS